jgi:arginase
VFDTCVGTSALRSGWYCLGDDRTVALCRQPDQVTDSAEPGSARRLRVIDSPSNLGLRPPTPGTVPGCYKLGWALREAGLLDRLVVEYLGTVIPPRYEAGWRPGDGDRNAEAIAAVSLRLADRLGTAPAGSFTVVLGGDCSNMIGIMLGLSRHGRYGLAFLDGHDDFRHPGNSDTIGAAAGEDLAIVTGRGDERLRNIEGRSPYVATTDIAVAGVRANDPDGDLDELRDLGIPTWTSEQIRSDASGLARRVIDHLSRPELDGFWIHLDVDILDESIMPAVDSPSADGIMPDHLAALLTPLAASPRCVGLDVSVFDPDLDPDGRHARTLVGVLEPVLAGASRPGGPARREARPPGLAG